ncbi:MAG: PAS domain S-box protein [Thermodesulfovibrionales bacterium]
MESDKNIAISHEYAESIVNTVREPLLVLDQDLRVVTASRSFYEVFKARPEDTVGQLIYNLGNKQWDIPKLRELLETILPQKATFDDYEVEHDFADIGRRTMLLNARRIPRPPEKPKVILLAIEDITKRRQAEEALKTSEDRLKTMFREAPLGIALIDSLTGHVYEVNHMFARIVGRTLEQMTDIDWMSITHPDDLRKDLDNMALLSAGKIQGFHMEKRYLHPDGRVVWVNMTVAPLKIEGNVKSRHLCMIEDITERKRLEKSRKELEVNKLSEDEAREYSESIINTVREPLIILDQDLRVVTVSRSFYEFFKVKPEETVGQLIYDLGNKQWDIPKLRELLETILPQKATFDDYEVEHDFSTIGRRIMLLNARQIQRVLGKEQIILLAIEDITARREIENGLIKTRQELEATKISEDEAREYAESIIDTVREALIALDQDLRVVSASRSFYEFFQVKPEETVGQLIYDLGNKQWDIPKLRELLETILPQKATFDNYEVEHDFSSIGRRIMLLNARQLQRVLGKERIILLAIEDITVRREIENGLGKAHEELTELAAELKRAARVKSEFLANMSHELRTPLNSINGFSEVLFDETFGPLNEKQKKYVSNVLTSGKHLLLLINQILDMAKVEAGKMKLALSSLPMKSLLYDISMLVADMAGKKKIEMLIEIAEDLPDIEADELKVKEIIYNLLSNAVKFTPEGGRIGLRAKKADSGIDVVVWDTGVGIAPENMEKIFEGFFRVDTPYSRVTEGTGLGLPLSKNLVELHGGKLSVESQGLGRGTSVRFTLPVVSGKVVCDD